VTNPRAKNRKRQALTVLLWGIGVFILSQLGLAVAIEYWFTELRDPEFGCRLARLYPRTAAADHPYTVLMLGSSRTMAGFQSSWLEQKLSRRFQRPFVVFNFGITGAGPLMQLLDLKRLLERGIHPDLLLIEVTPPLLTGHVPHELLRLPATRVWRNELPLLERYGGAREELWSLWWQSWPVPCYTRRFALLSRFLPAWLPYQLRMDWAYQIDDSGWVDMPVNRTTPALRRRAVEHAHQEYMGYFTGFRLAGAAPEALREMLGLCRRERISVALVLMPEGGEFRAWYPPGVWEQIDTFLTELRREYSVPLINAREWIADADFSDSHHLLPRGAAAFTERLEREGILPLIQGEMCP
jgi:hypothetical protein